MEGVEGELGDGLADALGGDDADHVPGVGVGQAEAVADLAHDLGQVLGPQAQPQDDLLGAQVPAQQHAQHGHARHAPRDLQLGDQRVAGLEHRGGREVGHQAPGAAAAALVLGRLLLGRPGALGRAAQDALEGDGVAHRLLAGAVEHARGDEGPVLEHALEAAGAAVQPVGGLALEGLGGHHRAHLGDVGLREEVAGHEGGRLVGQELRHGLDLDERGVHAVVAGQELDDGLAGAAHREVVHDLGVLEGLHQLALRVAGLRGVADLQPVGQAEVERRRHREVVDLGVGGLARLGGQVDDLDGDDGVQHHVVVRHEAGANVGRGLRLVLVGGGALLLGARDRRATHPNGAVGEGRHDVHPRKQHGDAGGQARRRRREADLVHVHDGEAGGSRVRSVFEERLLVAKALARALHEGLGGAEGEVGHAQLPGLVPRQAAKRVEGGGGGLCAGKRKNVRRVGRMVAAGKPKAQAHARHLVQREALDLRQGGRRRGRRAQARRDGHAVADLDGGRELLAEFAELLVPHQQRLGLGDDDLPPARGGDLVELGAGVVARDGRDLAPRHHAGLVRRGDAHGLVVVEVQELHAAQQVALDGLRRRRGELGVDPVADGDGLGHAALHDHDGRVAGDRLDGGVDEALAPGDGVEEVLGRAQAADEAAGDVAARGGGAVEAREVGHGAPVAVGVDARAVDPLLADAGHHLLDVERVALGLAADGGHHAVVVPQHAHERGARGVVVGGGHALELLLKVLVVGQRGVVVEALDVHGGDAVVDGPVHGVHVVAHGALDLLAGHQVRHAHREAVGAQPGVGQALHVVDEAHGGLGPLVGPRGVHEAAAGGVKDAPGQRAAQVLAAAHDHEVLRRGGVVAVGEGVVGHVQVQRRGEADARGLAAGEGPPPGRAGLGQAPAEARRLHHEVHELAARDADAVLGHAVQAQQAVLHRVDGGLAVLGVDHQPRDGREVVQLAARLDALRVVGVHLVAVEVGVVGRRGAHVEAEGVVGHDAHAVAHQAHLVQRRLAVEEDDVLVEQVAVDDVAGLQLDRHGLAAEAQGHHLGEALAVALDAGRARVLVGAARDELAQERDVVLVDDLAEGLVHGDAQGHAQLVDADERVGRDDGARGLVAALAHEVVAHAALLLAEARADARHRALGVRHDGDLGARLVVDEGRRVELHQAVGLLDVALVAALDGLLERVVVLDDLPEDGGQVVVRALLGVVLRRRAHDRRRHQLHRLDQPVGAAGLGVEAERVAVGVRDPLEDLEHVAGLEHAQGRRGRGVVACCRRRLEGCGLGQRLENGEVLLLVVRLRVRVRLRLRAPRAPR